MKLIKRIFSLILCLAILLSSTIFVNAEGNVLDKNKYIKMGIYFSSTFAREITITCKSGFLVYDEESGQLIDRIKDTSVHFTMDDTSCSGKIYMSANEDEDERYVGIKTNRGGKLDTTYRDGILLVCNNGLRVVNYITLEHYVWGVVNKEMSIKFPAEALKAQAVAARAFALQEHHNGFNVCTTTDCQAYGFVSGENDITTQACKDTEGIVAVYDGEPIHAYFSSSSGGGYMLGLSDAWGLKDVPYLQTKKDEFTPDDTGASPWQFYNTFSELETKLIQAGYIDVGKIKKFEITKETSFGLVTEITVTGTKGTVVVPANKIMSVFDLKSKFLTIGDKDYHIITKSNTGSSANKRWVLTLSGLQEIDTSELFFFNGYSVSNYPKTNEGSYIKTSDVCTSGYVYWYGLGFGHGIGMSQYGAKAMADLGYTYDSILKYYYPGIDLVNWYY